MGKLKFSKDNKEALVFDFSANKIFSNSKDLNTLSALTKPTYCSTVNCYNCTQKQCNDVNCYQVKCHEVQCSQVQCSQVKCNQKKCSNKQCSNCTTQKCNYSYCTQCTGGGTPSNCSEDCNFNCGTGQCTNC